MKAWDFEAMVYDGEVYCCECLPDEARTKNNDECNPIFASSEWDYYPVCNKCEEQHKYVGLTDAGRIYERKAYRNGDPIELSCGCNGCSPSMINGVLCHEQGCPDAWRDKAVEECDKGNYDD